MKASIRALLNRNNSDPVDTVARATQAAEARWDKQQSLEERVAFDWQNADLGECERFLVLLMKAYNTGAKTYQMRLGRQVQEQMKCRQCDKHIKDKWVSNYTVKDKSTGLLRNIYFCSMACDTRWKQAGRPQ